MDINKILVVLPSYLTLLGAMSMLLSTFQRGGKRKMEDNDDEMDEAFGKRSKRKSADIGEEYRAKVITEP